MTFENSLTSHLEALRSPNPPSTASENAKGYTTPSRYSGSFMASHSQPSNEAVRVGLQRRFTTDLIKMPKLTPIGQPPATKVEPIEQPSATNFHLHQSKLVEKKRLELEYLQEHNQHFKQIIDEQEARQKMELEQMTQDLNRVNLSAGHQSEPTTPPEYREYAYPSSSVFARTNRYSTSSLASPPGLNNRSSRSGSVLASQPTELAQTLHNHISSDTLPSKSVPGSRRGSNDRVSAYLPELSSISQRPAASNRYSMPVTGSTKRHSEVASDFASIMGLGHINTTGFLFGDDDEKSMRKEATTSPNVKSYLQVHDTHDKFPILIQSKDNVLSASSRALDLALPESPAPESQVNGWTPFAARHRPSQHSLPQNIFPTQHNDQLNYTTPTSVSQQQSPEAMSNTRQLHRHSMEASFGPYSQASLASLAISNDTSRPTLPPIQSSFSTNDIPTMKSTSGIGGMVTPTKTQAEQQFHNHNASLGRIPLQRMNNHHSRELSGGESRREDSNNGYSLFSSALQANATPFGPSSPTTSPIESRALDPIPSGIVPMPIGPQHYSVPAFYGSYGMQLTNMGMASIPMGNPLAFSTQIQPFQPQNAFNTFQGYGQPPRFTDSQARVIQQRRLQNGEDNSRFTNVKLEQVQGDIYTLCKDQHGCRYLQKKLEERNPEYVHMIFLETNQHVVELMTDPFGNYLCQKLLEFSDEEQRTVLINNAAPQMVKIALNQHGTRALQKMIEYISTREQIQTIIFALQDRVVELIQDLNGNHVIQKCLNRLTPEDAQFIFDGVGNNCIVVGTHRHGCCVLQRCIDHASGHQKAQLISQITANAFSLVQDPFGNYVVQYIVDLAESAFTDPLCYSFQGRIPLLSKQKFSSNVIEKCLRGAQPSVTRMMIEEMLNANELEKMLTDSFANYVVQTALDYADPDTKNKLIEAIRPILPSIRQTPYGRRIHSKIIGNEGQSRGRLSSGPATPHDGSSPGQIPLAKSMHTAPSTVTSYGSSLVNGYQAMNSHYATPGAVPFQSSGGLNHVGTFSQSSNSTGPSQAFSNGSTSTFSKFAGDDNINSVQQPTQTYARTSQVNGFTFF